MHDHLNGALNKGDEVTRNLEALKNWIGQKESAVDYVTIPLVHRLAATLDRDDPMPKHGDLLPIGWHVILFPRIVRHSQLGSDGTPKFGDFLPPVPLPRRMLAGKRITFVADLRVGDEVRRESTIKNIATRTEGYPDLVTNGALTTLLAFELARSNAATPLRFLSARNVRPLFVNQPFTVCGEPSNDGKSATLWAMHDSNALALSATAEFR